jgi:hypothetical protein
MIALLFSEMVLGVLDGGLAALIVRAVEELG